MFSDNPRGAWIEVAKVGYLATVAVTLYVSTETEQDLTRWIRAFLAGSLLTILGCLLGWFHYYVLHKVDSPFLTDMGSLPGYLPRVCSTFATSSMFCNYVIVAFCLAWWYWRRKKVMPRFLLATGLLFAGCTSLSSGIGGLALAFVWLALGDHLAEAESKSGRTQHLVRSATLTLVSIFCLAMLLGGLFGVKTLYFNNWRARGVAVRLACWSQAEQGWQERPLLGWGGGQEPILVRAGPYVFSDAHNWVLSTAAQWGSVALVVLFGIVVFSMGINTSRGRGSSLFPLQIALCTALLYDGILGSFEDARHIWILLGLLGAENCRRRACRDMNQTNSDEPAQT